MSIDLYPNAQGLREFAETVKSMIVKVKGGVPITRTERRDQTLDALGPGHQRPSIADPDDRSNLITQLERLSALRDRGAITEEEFQAAKRRLLSD